MNRHFIIRCTDKLLLRGRLPHKHQKNSPFLRLLGDVSSAVTFTAPSPPSLPANISSRLLNSSEICSTLRFVSAGNGNRMIGRGINHKTKERASLKFESQVSFLAGIFIKKTTICFKMRKIKKKSRGLQDALLCPSMFFYSLTDLCLDVIHVLLGT